MTLIRTFFPKIRALFPISEKGQRRPLPLTPPSYVPANLLFNCFAEFALSLVDKVTIGTCNLISVTANFAVSPALYKIHS